MGNQSWKSQQPRYTHDVFVSGTHLLQFRLLFSFMHHHPCLFRWIRIVLHMYHQLDLNQTWWDLEIWTSKSSLIIKELQFLLS